jgi:hypothetical protein
MSNIINNAIAHFSAKQVRELRVDEWDTTLYSKNLSLEDKAKWHSRADGDSTDYLIYAVIFGVTDDKGDAVFDIGDKVKLRQKVDPEVLGKVASFVLLGNDDTEETREGN